MIDIRVQLSFFCSCIDFLLILDGLEVLRTRHYPTEKLRRETGRGKSLTDVNVEPDESTHPENCGVQRAAESGDGVIAEALLPSLPGHRQAHQVRSGQGPEHQFNIMRLKYFRCNFLELQTCHSIIYLYLSISYHSAV